MADMRDYNIRPCPCCGRNDVRISTERHETRNKHNALITSTTQYWIHCGYCYVQTSKQFYLEDVVCDWNRRAENGN